MNTDTPEPNQWETYCDECYYHMWKVRRKTERGWHYGFHIHTGEEAKGLCDLLNKLERERDEARAEAQLYRNFYCESGEEIELTILPWETKHNQ